MVIILIEITVITIIIMKVITCFQSKDYVCQITYHIPTACLVGRHLWITCLIRPMWSLCSCAVPAAVFRVVSCPSQEGIAFMIPTIMG